MNDITLMIILLVIGIAIGFILGLFVSSLRTPSRPAQKKPVQRESRLQTGPLPTQRSTAQEMPAPPVPQPRDNQSSLPPFTFDTPISAGSFNTIDVFARAIGGNAKLPPPEERSIAAQVDDILQEMLEDSPLREKGVRLVELPGKGLVVRVGQNQYEGVDAVPDQDIQALIRGAAAEWERRAIPEE